MLFLNLNNNFSCQEFDRLLCNCSVKGCRENTMRKTACLVCDVTLPATGVDKTDNLPIGITENLHMPRRIMVFTSFDAVILPLEKKRRSGAERSPCLYKSRGAVEGVRLTRLPIRLGVLDAQ